MRIEPSAAVEGPAVRSSIEGFQSYPHARAASRAAPSDSEVPFETASY